MLWTIIGILLVIALIQGLIEPFIIRTTYQLYPLDEVTTEKLQGRRTINPRTVFKKLPDTEKGRLRLLFFSDLHIQFFIVPKAYFIKRLLDTQPDLLVFGGDLISKEFQGRKGLKFLNALAKAAAKRSIPLFVVRGNHDKGIKDEDFAKTGACLLKNSGIRLKFRKTFQKSDAAAQEREYLLYGLDDRRTGHPDMQAALKQNALTHPDVYNISFTHSRLRFELLDDSAGGTELRRLVVAHNPDTVLGLSADDADYFFSGHFHGGQIRMPFRLEFKSLRGEQLSQEKYYNGVFLKNGIVSFISRGVGCVLFPLRFFSLPEITVFDID